MHLLDERGLSPQAGVPLFLMVELPSNVIEAERFIDEMKLTGGSIGSNDLVQTVYAVSRDDLEHYSHPGRRSLAGGQGDDPPGGRGLQKPRPRDRHLRPGAVRLPGRGAAVPGGCGISSISVTPDTVIKVRMAVAEAERTRRAVTKG